MINLVSLGMSCQTTHQLEIFASQNPGDFARTTSPFDWLICPPDSASDWLDAGLCDFEPAEITERMQHAYWSRHRLWFWHGFLESSATHRKLNPIGMADKELSKLSYQREQFRSVQLSRTIFVLSNTQNNLNTEVFKADEQECFEFTADKTDKLQAALDRFYGSAVNLQLVTREDRAESSLLERSNVTVLPQDRSNWKGNKLDWSRLLNQFRH